MNQSFIRKKQRNRMYRRTAADDTNSNGGKTLMKRGHANEYDEFEVNPPITRLNAISVRSLQKKFSRFSTKKMLAC